MKKIFISCKESVIENNRSFYGCFSIGPFTEGQGLTIANALRRTLLSECPGLAIISVLIEDVTHEYSTLPGVRDSVLDILLNLKEIVLKKGSNPWLFYKKKGLGSVYNSVGSSFFKPMVGYLKVKGPGIVRAKDLRLPPFVLMVDPDQYIATLSENGSLNMKVVIMEGKNYIIQKNNELMDYSMVKKRRLLLKSLKDLVNKSTFDPVPAFFDPNFKKTVNLKDILDSNQRTTQRSSASSPPSSHNGAGKKMDSSSLKGTKNNEQNEEICYPPFNSFRKASPLNIDAVFNPIKKVNYIIEVNNNKIVDYANDKYSFIDDISKFIESGELYKKNFPFLTNAYSSLLPFLPLEDWRKSASIDGTPSGKGGLKGKFPAGKQISTADTNLENCKTTSSILSKENFINSLIEYVEDYSTEELWVSSRSLHPLRKEGLLHTVMLEIWTNGSIHPREALSMAFSNLTSLFLNFEKTKIFSPMYKDVSSYKKCLTTNTFLPQNFITTSPLPGRQENGPFLNKFPNGGSSEATNLPDKSFMLEENNLDLTAGLLRPKFLSSGAKQPKKLHDNEMNTDEKGNLDISILNLNLRAYTLLKRLHINTVKDLSLLSKEKLLTNFNLDLTTVEILLKKLKEFMN